MSAFVVEKLWQEIPGFLERIDLIIGSSGGSVLAAGLGIGLTPTFISHFYEEGAIKTFSEKKLTIIKAKYSRKWMKLGYWLILGNMRMKDAQKKVMIPAWKLEMENKEGGGVPVLFHNFPNSTNADDHLVDVILRSSAAPVYFSTYQGYIDGGAFANNPMNAALPLLVGRSKEGLSIPIEDIRVLSVGTGISYDKIAGKELDWGVYQWGSKFISLLFDAQHASASRMCEVMLGDNYHRLTPNLDNSKYVDDIQAIPLFKEELNKMPIAEAIDWVKKNFK